MKQTIDLYHFRDAIQFMRPNNFSYDGLRVLFEHLEELENCSGEEIELDVIAICCEYTEANISEALERYDLKSLDELEDNTMVLYVDELSNYQSYDEDEDGDKRIIYIQY